MVRRTRPPRADDRRMKPVRIPIRSIKVPPRKRSLGDVSRLAESIGELGLLHPITLTPERRLVAGLHRLEACKALGWKVIDAVILDTDAMRTELVEIDENLARCDLTVLERGEFLARRKEIFESLHPEARRGVAGGVALAARRRGGSATEIISFAREAASRAGVTTRTVEQEVQIAGMLAADVKDLIRGTPVADSKVDLLMLARSAPADQRRAARLLVDGKAKDAVDALLMARNSRWKAASSTAAAPSDRAGATAEWPSEYEPLFPYYGGKARVAGTVWRALGDVKVYVEPFFGSGANLFLRPGGAGRHETANDVDGMLCNVWRALKRDPDAVAEHADNPVNECDVHARHLWLMGQRERITDRLCGDPDFYDAKAAGWWVWGINCWIGSGWCSGEGPWVSKDGIMVRAKTGQGVHRKRPRLGRVGGVNRVLPAIGNTGSGACAERLAWLKGYLRGFADRLRHVRVCCGDWSHVCTPTVTFHLGLTGVFVDAPYPDEAGRCGSLYAKDCGKVAHAVRAWAIESGRREDMRIVLCAYEGLGMPKGWRCAAWRSSGGYGLKGNGKGRMNRGRERLWYSPHCLPAE